MSDQQKKQKGARIKACALKIADKVGHVVRKAGPYIASVGLVVLVNTSKRNKDDTDNT